MFEIIGLILSAIGTVGGIAASNKAGKEQDKALEAQQTAEQRELRRQRMQQIRENRIKAAAATAGAAGSGTLGSSGAIGQVQNLNSQLMNNMAFSFGQEGLSNKANSAMQKSADYTSQANLFGSVGKVGNMFGGEDMWRTFFKNFGD